MATVEGALTRLAVGVCVGKQGRAILPALTRATTAVPRISSVVDFATVLDVAIAVEVIAGAAFYFALAVTAPSATVVDATAAGFGVAVFAARRATFAAVQRIDSQFRFAAVGVLFIAVAVTLAAVVDDAGASLAARASVRDQTQVAASSAVGLAVAQIRLALAVAVTVAETVLANRLAAACRVAENGCSLGFGLAHLTARATVCHVTRQVFLATVLGLLVAVVETGVAVDAADAFAAGSLTVQLDASVEADPAVIGILLEVDLAAVGRVEIAVFVRRLAFHDLAFAAHALCGRMRQIAGVVAGTTMIYVQRGIGFANVVTVAVSTADGASPGTLFVATVATNAVVVALARLVRRTALAFVAAAVDVGFFTVVFAVTTTWFDTHVVGTYTARAIVVLLATVPGQALPAVGTAAVHPGLSGASLIVATGFELADMVDARVRDTIVVDGAFSTIVARLTDATAVGVGLATVALSVLAEFVASESSARATLAGDLERWRIARSTAPKRSRKQDKHPAQYAGERWLRH